MKSADVSKTDSILLIAAEASSCMYAKNFISQWRERHPQCHFFGVGDRQMQSEGMDCLGFAEDMAVVGLQEVIKHYSEIRSCAEAILQKAKQDKPRFALLLDYPGFNLRMAKRLKKLEIPVVYYISPQLWAWKKGRVKQVQQFVDEMAVVFPFEVDFYKPYGVNAHFVGHPLVEIVDKELANHVPGPRKRKVLGLMPGSRRSEVQHNFTTQLAAARQLTADKDIDVKILLAPTLSKEDLLPYMNEDDSSFEFIQEAPSRMIQSCDVILTASGTATLQVALCLKPMVVMYKMNPITAFMAKLLVRSVKAFCIVNLIADKIVVPELFQEQATPQNLVAQLSVLFEESPESDRMLKELAQVKTKLGQGGATENLVSLLEERFAQ